MRDLLRVSLCLVVAGCAEAIFTTDGSMDDEVDPKQTGPIGPINCVPGTTQCTDCLDNDADGLIDGFDPHCSSAADNDEASFSTAIPGDNRDGTWQDCFFDGDSGSGNDGCRVHTCCLLDECPPDLAGSFDPATCTGSTEECIESCLGAVPPCCDCYGCCTICGPAGCFTVMTNPAIAPQCTIETLADPARCPSCTLDPICGRPPEHCGLCPGQVDPPDGCIAIECPADATPCRSSQECEPTDFCSAGCCIELAHVE